ncbi:hypothetical protein Aduo_013003 [Ancylostoma duodenale]
MSLIQLLPAIGIVKALLANGKRSTGRLHCGSNRPSTGMRQSPWLSDSLSQNVELDTLRSPAFGSVNGFAIEGTSVVAAVDICMLYMYENVSFPIGKATHH